MKMNETEKILDMLKAAYPNLYAFNTPQELRNTALLYYNLFSQYDIEIILAALKRYILEVEKNPCPAGLQRNLQDVMQHRRIQGQINTPQLTHTAEAIPMPDDVRKKRDEIFKRMGGRK